MIRDRGRIKWTAMMLPEHVNMLREWAKEDKWEQTKILDEQALEKLDEILTEAYHKKKRVKIEYEMNHCYETLDGFVHHCDQNVKEIFLKDEQGEMHSLMLEKIINIIIMDD